MIDHVESRNTSPNEITLRILTLNCWGIKGHSPDRVPRMEAIADYLALGTNDIVVLEEVWSEEDFRRLRDGCSKVLPYAHYFYSGVIGSGVCLLSKRPFECSLFHQWPLNGYFHKFMHGDWFGGKGIGLCQIDWDGFRVNIYATHLHAEYSFAKPEYEAHRVVQAFESAELIRLTSTGTDLVILAGDLNTEPDELVYQLLKGAVPLEDPFNILRPEVKDTGMEGTWMTPFNSYTTKKSLEEKPGGARLDYILYKAGPGIEAIPLSYSLPLPSRVPAREFSYSDHEGVQLALKVRRNHAAPRYEISSQRKHRLFCEGREVCQRALKDLDRRGRLYKILVFALITAMWYLSGVRNEFYIAPVGWIVCFLMCIYLVFMLVMGLRMERHAITAGVLAMSLRCSSCGCFSHDDDPTFEKSVDALHEA